MSTPHPDIPGARFFSLDEANRMLPLVRRIVDDIVERYAAMQPWVARVEALDAAERRGSRGRELSAELEERAKEVDALVTELQDLGCSFKGFGEGLVDWYSLYAGRPVFLCWKRGEPEIGWWHQIDAGFAGRQPILPTQRHAFRDRPDAS